MTKKNGTKRSLLMSAVALVLCFSMLVGSTFAWFTDSVTSSGNIIKSGKLDVTMEWTEGDAAVPAADDAAWTDASSGAIFNYSKWEPGYVDAKHIKIENVGNLAFNYQLHIVPNGTVSALANVIDVYFGDPAAAATRDTISSMQYVGTLASLIGDTDGAAYGKLYPVGNADNFESTKIVTIALKMQESAGNEYQELSIGTDFSVQLIANQLTYEKDSFGDQYDVNAEWPVVATGFAPVANSGATTIYVKDEKTPSMTIATVHVPEGAADEEASNIVVTVIETEKHDGVTVTSQQASATYDVTVTGLKDGNTKEVTVELYVGKNLTGVQLFRDGVLMDSSKYSYDPVGGVVTFKSATFSPFTVVYDAVAVEEPSEPTPDDWNPTVLPEGMPVAVVTDVTGTEEGTIDEWSAFGPFVAANTNQGLEVVYKFACPEEYDEKYNDWYCDFYVSVSEDIEEGQLFLGGNYGDFGWVGFDAPAVTANVEVALLGSAVGDNGELVTRGGGSDTGWTYEAVKNFVSTFYCGVAESVNNTDDLAGVTFTVNLSLTNPDNPDEYYNVNTITYTF